MEKPTLLSRIQQDLFDFTREEDPKHFAELVGLWYQVNSPALSAALTAQKGVNLILNVSSFRDFEHLAKRLFLVADTLVLRDSRDFASNTTEFGTIPVIQDEYRPAHLVETLSSLETLRPSPLTLITRPESGYWSSSTHKYKNGLSVAYAVGLDRFIPSEFIEWISGAGREYLASGRIVYAPFIPSLQMELEFLNSGISLPQQFGSQSLFHQSYDWLNGDSLQALLSLDIPFLDGIDISTLSKVKEDNYESFSIFSKSLNDSITGLKSSFGTEGFLREVRNIQRNQIDAALSDVRKTVDRINKSSALRKAGILTGTVGLGAAAFLGIPGSAIVTGIAASAAALVAERIAYFKDNNDLVDRKGHFLWKLEKKSKV